MQNNIVIVVFLMLLPTATIRAAITVDPWVPIFNGIEFARGHADANEIRLQEVQVLRVDLNNTNIAMFSTPSNGDAALETFGQTTSTFVLASGVQVGVNANFFSPVSTTPNEPRDLSGLAISQGNLVSPAESGREMLLITRSNIASIVSSVSNPSNYWTAVAGSDRVLINGIPQTFPSTDFMTNGHPRTAVGISQNGRYLIMMTIDGRQSGYSQGAPMTNVTEWLVRFGAYNGLNLDGGGSTAMVKSESGAAKVLNRPSGGVQRVNGNHLGVFAPILAPVFVTSPTNQTVVAGQNATFNVLAGGTTPLRYQWKFQGANISNATNSSLTLTNVQPNKAGNYSVVVTNSIGSITSAPAVLTANYSLISTPVIGGIILRSPNQTNFVPNTNVALTAVPNPGFVFAGWSGASTSTNNPLVLTMNTNKTVGAQFTGPANEIIIDNVSAIYSGAWTIGNTATGRYGPDYHFVGTTTNSPNSTATYRPNITKPGKYHVYIWYPEGGNRSPNAPWEINSSGESQIVFVNQQTNGGGWRLIATEKTFAQGTNGFVRLLNNANPSVVIADAVKFSLNPASPPQLLAPHFLAGSELHFTFFAPTGFSYAIESSLNLTNWTLITNVLHTNASLEFVVASTNHPTRFFRARWAP